MPNPRFIYRTEKRASYYHCVSRVVDRNFVFDVRERDVFRKILRQVEEFTGVRVLTWTILSNHFHVLLGVPPAPATPLSDTEILARCRALYAPDDMIPIEMEFEDAQQQSGEILSRLRNKYLRRMWDLSEFMKTLKQKFTRWFNRTHERVGTLWESRFTSVVVEGHWNSLLKVAAYIDLNPVRAGMVSDPKHYRWCGYSEALAGDRRSRRGLVDALAGLKARATWRDVAPRYRKILFGIGEETGVRSGISAEEVAKVWADGGQLSLPQLLRCRVRHLTSGLAIGTKDFLENLFERKRECFGNKRSNCSRNIPGGDWGGLYSARDLSKHAITLARDGP